MIGCYFYNNNQIFLQNKTVKHESDDLREGWQPSKNRKTNAKNFTYFLGKANTVGFRRALVRRWRNEFAGRWQPYRQKEQAVLVQTNWNSEHMGKESSIQLVGFNFTIRIWSRGGDWSFPYPVFWTFLDFSSSFTSIKTIFWSQMFGWKNRL